jgi:MFS family permease
MHTSLSKFLQKAIPIPTRVVMAIMGFLAVANAYTMRICLSVAITEMVKKKNATENQNLEDMCHFPDTSNNKTSTVNTEGLFDWSEEIQGVILSSFYWGYIITHVPGGLLAQRFGGKYVLSFGILSTAIFTLITPLAIDAGGAPVLIALRVLEGLGEGTTFPALSALLAMWIPLKERSKLGAFVFGGAQIGTILGNSLSGLVIDAFDDWRAVFYFFGVCGILWFCFFSLLCYNDPKSHPFITDREKAYLTRELGQIERNKDLPPTPWRSIVTNKAMIALVIAQIGHDFGYFVMVTDLPKYMSGVLKFNIKENGLYSALPYVLMWVVSLGSGAVGDYTIKNGIQSVTNSRKMFTTIASFGPSVFILAASFAGCDRTLAVTFFVLAMGCMGTYYAGMKINALDLSPNYAGTLMALTNGIAATTGIIGPYLVGLITTNSYISEWRTVFWIAFAIFSITNIVYLFWASGDVQPFNSPKQLENSAIVESQIGDMKQKEAEKKQSLTQ